MPFPLQPQANFDIITMSNQGNTGQRGGGGPAGEVMTEVSVGVVAVDRLVGVEVCLEEVGVNSKVEGEVDSIIEAVVEVLVVQ